MGNNACEKSLFKDLSEDDLIQLIGVETEDVIGGAFPRKRVVHPGIKGKMIPMPEYATRWADTMRSLGEPGKRTAYIHIPFCQSRCLYCGFFQNFSESEMESRYVDRLIAELASNARTRYGIAYPLHAVYFGGGTPSVLSARNIQRLLRAVRKYLPLANDCEITFEARIHNFDDEKINACLENGVNRFSFGVQSFDTEVRRSVGRLDDGETVLRRLDELHARDQAAMVVDLIYGLPFQSMDVWRKDLQTLLNAGIDGVDLYKLNVYDNSLLKKAIEEKILPAGSDLPGQGKMFAEGKGFMESNHFRRLSICHWGRNGRERNLYNSLNKGGATVLPFGAGAGGNLDGLVVSLERDMQRYLQRVDNHEKPIQFMMSPHRDFRLHAFVVGQIESGYLNTQQLTRQFGVQTDSVDAAFDIWCQRGLANRIMHGFQLSLAGQFWYVNITQSVLELLATDEGGKTNLDQSLMAY